MKTKTKIIYFLIISLNFYFAYRLNYYANEKKEVSGLINAYKDLKEKEIAELKTQIKQRDTMLIQLYKPIVRLQLIAGIKEPDTTFTYLEKIMHPVNLKALINHDFRKKEE